MAAEEPEQEDAWARDDHAHYTYWPFAPLNRTQLAEARQIADQRATQFLELWASGRRDEALARYGGLDAVQGCSGSCVRLSLELLRRTGDGELAGALMGAHGDRSPWWGCHGLAVAARGCHVALFQLLLERLRNKRCFGTPLAEAAVLAPADGFDFVGQVLTECSDGPVAIARAAAGLNRRDVFERALLALAPHGGELPAPVARCVVSQGWLDVLEDGGFRFNPLALSSTSSTAVLDRMLASPVLRPMLVQDERGMTVFDAFAARKRRRGQQLAAHLLAALTPAERATVAGGSDFAALVQRIASRLHCCNYCPRPAAAALVLDAVPSEDTVAVVAPLALQTMLKAYDPLPPYALETFRVLMGHPAVAPICVADVLALTRQEPAPNSHPSWVERWRLRKATALKAALSLQRCARVTAAERAELVEAVGPELAPLAMGFGAWARHRPLLLARALVRQGRATALGSSSEGFVARAPGAVVRSVVSFL